MAVLRRIVALRRPGFLIAATGLAVLPLVFQPAQGAPPANRGASTRKAPADRTAPAERAAVRPKPFEPDKLVRAFRGRREDVRLKALDEVEQLYLADPAVPEALWQAIEPAIRNHHVPDSLLYALKLYGKVDDQPSGQRLLSLLAAADLRVVLYGVDLLGERRPADSLPALTGLREHRDFATSYALRHAVVSAISRFSEPAGVDFLVSTIAASDGQLKYLAAVHLTRLTGENFGGKGNDWKEWWDAHREGFRIASGGAKKPAPGPMPWDYPVPQFYGAPVYAKRVVFVLDRSKSMLSSIEGVVRLEDAAGQLEKAVRALPEDASFEIIAYNDAALPFAGRLVPATTRTKSDAVRFVYSLAPEGKTASFDALADALRVDGGVEAILFLSDGDPNSGTIVDRPAIVAAITQQNHVLRAAIDAIGIDARGGSEEFLKKLAADNFGTYRRSIR